MIFRLIYAFIAVVFIVAIARAEAIDALDEVNAARAQRGLRPFARDANLTAGAMQAATIRAAHRVHGHLANDFNCLPPGTTAAAAGCGVEYAGFGWLACCTYENWQSAGAAKARDSSGRWYFHLFVNGGSGVSNGATFQSRSTVNNRRRR
jgi:hypothetical protein